MRLKLLSCGNPQHPDTSIKKTHLSIKWLDGGKNSFCNNNFPTLSFAKNSHMDKVDCLMVCRFWKTFKRVKELLYLKQPPANCQKCQHLGQFFAEVHRLNITLIWKTMQCSLANWPASRPNPDYDSPHPPNFLFSQIASRCLSQLSVVLLP